MIEQLDIELDATTQRKLADIMATRNIKTPQECLTCLIMEA